MQFIYEVPDDLIESVERYLSGQLQQTRDEVTGATVTSRTEGHEDPATFFRHKLDEMLHQIVQQYPTPAVRERMLAAKALADEVKAMARVTGKKAELHARAEKEA